MIYLDTSALLKLVFPEEGSDAVAKPVSADVDMVSSELLLVEARRGTARRAPGRPPRLDLLLGRVELIEMSRAVLEAASRLEEPMLRTLDAIHVATALSDPGPGSVENEVVARWTGP
ncbi:type II toxin-antitoxin system VapC family toxin [Pseudonocardia lacus]|uniref:type II toxin-antitoxin system VapC family toxin n=1 Tax=Pseudonocardia lacus TaxID=2835865 RepID=UPI001BDC2EF1|nr:type II toxin-antitoxin system VapC family toxin [Pseudonocardia lacus]